jgi:hypothetical protein
MAPFPQGFSIRLNAGRLPVRISQFVPVGAAARNAARFNGFCLDLRGVLQRQAKAGSIGNDYKYALMVVAGLLRVREDDPWALTKDRSAAATGLAEDLKTMAATLQSGRARATEGEQKLTLTEALIAYLETDTGRPDNLTAIDQIDSTDQGEE